MTISKNIMEKALPRQADKKQDLFQLLYRCQEQKADQDIHITSDFRHGVIHVRNGDLVSANADVLHGHGAVLSLLHTPSPEVEVIASNKAIRKTISYTLPQLEKIISAVKFPDKPLTEKEEAALLDEAKIAIFLFQLKKASQNLAKILRSNRFYYPAWLWQSRIIYRQQNISKALDEACRWGNCDQEVWREVRKIRPQLTEVQENIKRCYFCWSVMQERDQCSFCNSLLLISDKQPSVDCKVDDVRYALSLFDKALKHDPRYAQTAYFLAIGHYNLKEFSHALRFIKLAKELSPRTGLYGKGEDDLKILVAETGGQTATKKHRQNGRSSKNNNKVLLVEDSKTSQKVISMLLEKNGFTVRKAVTGAECMALCQEETPGLLILDVKLPDMTGLDLLPKFRELTLGENIPVIMLTASLTSKDRFIGGKYGVKDFLAKPFDPAKLLTIIDNYLPGIKAPDEDKPRAVKTVSTKKKEVKRPETSPVDSSKKTVFVIEDSPTSRKVLNMILKKNGFNVVEAASGKDALSLAEKIVPDLILLDLMLPDMTGYELFPKLKTISGLDEIPVFILTGKRAPTDKMKGMLLGSNEYVTKPFNPEKLVGLIKRYM